MVFPAAFPVPFDLMRMSRNDYLVVVLMRDIMYVQEGNIFVVSFLGLEMPWHLISPL